MPVHLDNRVHRRLPPRVEGTLYFVVAEALTNVARYSQAPEVFVTVADENDSVALEVIDHGVGGADQSRAPACSAWPTGSPSWTAPSSSTARRAADDDQLPGPGPRCVVPEQAVRETVVEPVS